MYIGVTDPNGKNWGVEIRDEDLVKVLGAALHEALPYDTLMDAAAEAGMGVGKTMDAEEMGEHMGRELNDAEIGRGVAEALAADSNFFRAIKEGLRG